MKTSFYRIVADVLKGARGMVARPGGWARTWRDGGRVCAVQAVCDAVAKHEVHHVRMINSALPPPEFPAAIDDLLVAIDALPGSTFNQVVAFNDDAATTQSVVVAMFDRAIVRAEGQAVIEEWAEEVEERKGRDVLQALIEEEVQVVVVEELLA